MTAQKLRLLKIKGKGLGEPEGLPDATAEESIKVTTEERSILTNVDKKRA